MSITAHTRLAAAALAMFWMTAVCSLGGCGLEPAAIGQTADSVQIGATDTVVRSAEPGDQRQLAALPPELIERVQRHRTTDEPAADHVPQAQNGLIRGLQQLLDTSLGATDFTEERDDLGQSLIEADSILTRVKQENRAAMRQAFRQQRILGPASPNIVLIVAQDLAAADLQCYGGELATPHIDRLAAEGLRFTDFRGIGAAARTGRWSLMTGLTPGNSDASPDLLHPEHFTLGEVLWQAGYATGFIGLWGIQESARLQGPNAHGFDEWFGYFREEETAADYPEMMWSNSNQLKVLANAGGKRGQSAHEFLMQEALSFLERRSRRPFFLIVVLPLPAEASDPSAGIARLDQSVGAVVEKLTALGVDRNTSLWLTSTGNETKALVPLVVRWPNRVPAGRVSSRVSGLPDLLPTFADLVGAIQKPQQSDGTPLLSTLTTDAAETATTGD